MDVTLKDIARHCNVSVATVSKALNNMPDISPAMVKRIQDTAAEMGYFPNATARAMKTGRSKTIGLLFFLRTQSVWTHEYFARIADSIQRFTEEKGYDITPVNCRGESVAGSYLRYCLSRGYDGVVVMSSSFSDPSLMELVDSGIPLVTIDYRFDHRDAVISDNRQGMRDLVRHVHALGHRSIALIHGEDSAVTSERVESFRATCRDLQLDVPAAYVRRAYYHDPPSSAQATRALLRLPNRPTCILYPDDFSYLGGMEELLRQGASIPEDMSCAGYDGIALADALYPRLTTLEQDMNGVGFHAAQMLLDAIEKPKRFAPRHILLSGRLRPGESIRDLRGMPKTGTHGRVGLKK